MSEGFENEKTSIDFYFQEVDDGPLLTREQEINLAKDVDVARYRYPKEHEKKGLVSFTKIWADGVEPKILRNAIRSREKMISANLRLVAKIAKRYQNRGCDLEDLIQEGNLGLIRGIDGYDYTKTHTDNETGKVTNIKLSTYCTAWIHQRINRLIQNQSRTVRIPVHVQTLSTKVQKIVEDHILQFGSKPTTNQLLDFVNEKFQNTKQNSKTKEAVIQALACPRMNVVSLDNTNYWADNAALINSGEDGRIFEDSIFRQEMIEAVRATLHHLSPREEKISRLRFGVTEDPFRHDLKPCSIEMHKKIQNKKRKKNT